MEVKGTNLEVVGRGVDAYGNSIIKVQMPNERAFSIQTNGNLPKWHREAGAIMSKTGQPVRDMDTKDAKELANELVNYIQKHGSAKQKAKLKLYNSFNESFEDTIDKVRIDLSSGKINKAEASRRLNAINKAILDDAEGYDPDLMDEDMEDSIEFEDVVQPEEIGDVEVEKVLAPEEELPIEHADEPVEMLDVFSVYNDELSDEEFYAVVDVMDDDADTGITFVQLTESGEVDHEATNELVQNVVDKLEAEGYEVVNLNDAGVDAEGTEGDEIVAAEMELGEAEDEAAELEFADDMHDEGVNELDEPVEGGFKVMGNPDGSVTVLGAPEILLPTTFGDAVDDVVAELSEMPYVSDETEQVLESRVKSIKESLIKSLVESREADIQSAETTLDAGYGDAEYIADTLQEFNVDFKSVLNYAREMYGKKDIDTNEFITALYHLAVDKALDVLGVDDADVVYEHINFVVNYGNSSLEVNEEEVDDFEQLVDEIRKVA